MRVFWKTEAILFLSAVAVRILFYSFSGFTADDAFITYRYAENILLGHGFVYNIGDRVLGTSTPLFTLLLATLGIFHTNLQNWSLLISLLASGITSVILYRFARSLRYASFAVLPSVLFICWPRSLAADTSGMETAVFTLLITAAFYMQHKKAPFWAIGLATLATLTRMEAALPLAILVITNIVNDRSRWVSFLATPLFLLLPWCLFAWQYFGSPLPHSIPAKLALYSQFGTTSWEENLISLLWLNTPLGWMLLVTGVFGLHWLVRTQNAGKIETAWIALMILFFTFSKTHLFFWYISPIYPLYFLIASAAVPYFADRFALLPSRQHIAAIVVSAISATLLLIVDIIPAKEYSAQAESLAANHEAIGYYLRTHANESEIVAAEDIGYMGYISKLRIIDRDGLVSPEVVSYNRVGDYKGVVTSLHPDWVVAAKNSPISGFITDADFTENYAFIQHFGKDSTSGYLLFRRIDDQW